MSTRVPPVPAGAVAVMEVLEFTTKLAALPPNLTAVAPTNAFPVRVTAVPPPTGPLGGETALTEGVAKK